jgi:hypothetical protein
MQSFTSPPSKEPIQFDVDGDVFEAAGAPPGGALLDVVAFATGTNLQRMKAIGDFLDVALLPESRDRFLARLRSTDRPISLATASQIMAWLLGQYSGRPTVPSTSTPNGQHPVGVSSTAGVPPEE